MYWVKVIINACASILSYKLSLCGYSISLLNFLALSVFVLVAFRILKFLLR